MFNDLCIVFVTALFGTLIGMIPYVLTLIGKIAILSKYEHGHKEIEMKIAELDTLISLQKLQMKSKG